MSAGTGGGVRSRGQPRTTQRKLWSPGVAQEKIQEILAGTPWLAPVFPMAWRFPAVKKSKGILARIDSLSDTRWRSTSPGSDIPEPLDELLPWTEEIKCLSCHPRARAVQAVELDAHIYSGAAASKKGVICTTRAGPVQVCTELRRGPGRWEI